MPKLVPREELSSAIALNSMGINISRVIGIAAALWWWSSATAARTLPPEHVGGAIRAGLRYAVYSGPLKATLIRAAAFFLFASAFWAMLPLIA